MKKQGFLRTIIFTILLCGLGAGIIAVGQRQEIRKKAAQDGEFTFAALGDTHAGLTDPDLANYRERADANHRSAIEAIIKINPDFYLLLGDMVHYPIDVAWNDFFAIEKPLMDKVPAYPTIGNHEGYNESHSYYHRFKNLTHLKSLLIEDRPWYSFDWGNAHFISLRVDYDNYYPQGEACRPGSAQYQWLENDLKSTDKPWKIVFFHDQIYSSTAEQTPERKATRKYLHPLFKKYQVDLVFGAHDHCYERVEADGITYIESGGGSNRREPLAAMPGTKSISVKNHIVKVSINGGVLSGTAISTHAMLPKKKIEAGGEILDTFRLTKTILPTASPTPTLTPTPSPTPSPTPTSAPSSSPTPTPTPLPGLYKGDLNSDGVINGLDWSIMKLKFGQSATLEEGDLNQDGQINGLDWSIMSMYYGQEEM
jgi:predicted MPP superfamily phosphohydrolase